MFDQADHAPRFDISGEPVLSSIIGPRGKLSVNLTARMFTPMDGDIRGKARL